MSPAAKIPGTLVSRKAFTTTPRSRTSPAFSASPVRGQCNAAAEFHLSAVDAARGVLEMECNTILLVEGADEVAHLRTQDPLHGTLARRHDMNFDIARAQGC